MLTNKCSLSKRIYAFLIDLSLILITSLFLELAVCLPIANSSFNYASDKEVLFVEKINSYAFVCVDNEYELIVDGSSSEEEIKIAYKNSNYKIVNISEFVANNENANSETYISYLDKFYSQIESDSFVNLKTESGLFSDIENNVFASKVEEENRITFCNEVLEMVDDDIILYKDGIINALQANVYSIEIVIQIISFLVPSLIFLFIIPLTSKYRSSLGKKIFKLGVTNKYYVPCNALLLTTRFLAFLLIEMLLSLFLIGIPLAVSFILILLLKNGQCIHDFLSTTLVVDLTEFEPFKNIDEYADFIRKEKEAQERSLRKPYDN